MVSNERFVNGSTRGPFSGVQWHFPILWRDVSIRILLQYPSKHTASEGPLTILVAHQLLRNGQSNPATCWAQFLPSGVTSHPHQPTLNGGIVYPTLAALNPKCFCIFNYFQIATVSQSRELNLVVLKWAPRLILVCCHYLLENNQIVNIKKARRRKWLSKTGNTQCSNLEIFMKFVKQEVIG